MAGAGSESIVPILPSRDLAATAAFYVGQLGFEPSPSWQGYAIHRRGAAQLHFFHHPTLDPRANDAGAYWYAPDPDALHAEFARRAIPRLFPLEDKPWGMREFALLDPDANLLRIGRRLAPRSN